jgi:hypothetical protein
MAYSNGGASKAWPGARTQVGGPAVAARSEMDLCGQSASGAAQRKVGRVGRQRSCHGLPRRAGGHGRSWSRRGPSTHRMWRAGPQGRRNHWRARTTAVPADRRPGSRATREPLMKRQSSWHNASNRSEQGTRGGHPHVRIQHGWPGRVQPHSTETPGGRQPFTTYRGRPASDAGCRQLPATRPGLAGILLALGGSSGHGETCSSPSRRVRPIHVHLATSLPVSVTSVGVVYRRPLGDLVVEVMR